ncbi:LysR substrate-binding domain-containing protein [Albidovulum aquaemixtae]|uniref:LysR substrate-binding domain-containing protein n=1 Tax=Albidovulum aquaemixtae TaxID=1542388 RepID=UPI001FE3F647|nr:LysR substrate-binding domain-containing protein [Defluviimonas aquaemixtae]
MFEAAARHGSFTRAAAELGMTQAAVSYQVKVLEDRVGMPLFRRRARGVCLTAEGARLAERSGEAMEILRQAFAEARRDSQETLVISVLATFATHVLAPALGRFQIEHPEITTRVEVDHRLADLLTGEASVAIRAGQGKWPGLMADHLMRSRFTPMVSPEFERRHGPFRKPQDLLKVPRLDADDPCWALWFEAAGVPPPPVGARGSSWLGAQILDAQAALAGHGACLLTPLYFRSALERGDLIQPFDLVAEEDLSLWLVYPERRRNAPAVRAFRAWLLAEMRALGGDVVRQAAGA